MHNRDLLFLWALYIWLISTIIMCVIMLKENKTRIIQINNMDSKDVDCFRLYLSKNCTK